MQNNNLIFTFNELYEFFKKHDYHITRVSLPIISDDYHSDATYFLTYGVGMENALTQVECGNIKTYNTMDKKSNAFIRAFKCINARPTLRPSLMFSVSGLTNSDTYSSNLLPSSMLSSPPETTEAKILPNNPSMLFTSFSINLSIKNKQFNDMLRSIFAL